MATIIADAHERIDSNPEREERMDRHNNLYGREVGGRYGRERGISHSGAASDCSDAARQGHLDFFECPCLPAPAPDSLAMPDAPLSNVARQRAKMTSSRKFEIAA
jgi:hypothetical protein